MGAKGFIFGLAAVVVGLGVARSGWLDRSGWVDRMAPAGGSLGGALGARRVEVAFWNGFTGPDGRVMLEIVREFNEREGSGRGDESQGNGGGFVTMQRMEWGTYYNKLMVAAVDGRGPEVFVVHASTLPRMVRAGFVSGADEVYGERGERAGEEGVPLGDFDERVLEQLRYGGRYVGVALDVHPQGLYANAAMLREVGVGRLPETGEELVELAGRIKVHGGGGEEVWGFSLTNWRWNFCSIAYQYGGRFVDSAGGPTLDAKENVAALERMVALVRTERVAPDPENNLGWVGFRQKKIGMVCDGIYMLGDLKRLEGFEYVAGPTPRFGPMAGTHGDSHVLCIRTGLSAEKRAAAVRLVRFLSQRSVKWAEAGQVPARRSARETEAFRAMPVQYAFSKQLPYTVYPPRTPILFELMAEVDLAVERALRGRMAPAEALATGQANVLRFMERERRERSLPTADEAMRQGEGR